jgi:hypothetical protein
MAHEEDWPEEDFYESGNVRDMRGHNSDLEEEDGEDLEPLPSMGGLSLEDQLKLGRQILLERLIKAVHQGHATPQEMNTLRQMLKDNGMVMGDPTEGPEESDQNGERPGKAKADLPSFEPPEYAQ